MTYARIASLAPYPSLSFYVPPQPISTPISSRPNHLDNKVKNENVDLIQLLRQSDHHQLSTLLGRQFHAGDLDGIIKKVEKSIGFNVYSAVYLKNTSIDDIKDIQLQSEAGQIHLLRIADTSKAGTLKVEFQLHSWISTLNLGSSLPFDKAVASSWIDQNEKDSDSELGSDGLVWSLYEVRGGNGSVVADWKSLDDGSKLHLLSSLTQILTTLHSINLPSSILSILEEASQDQELEIKHLTLEPRSTESYVYDFLSTILDLNTHSQDERRGRHHHDAPSSDDLDSSSISDSVNGPRSDSAVAGLSTSPQTYRNEEMKSRLNENKLGSLREDSREKKQKWLDLIMENFPQDVEKKVESGTARLILNPANFFSEAQILINPPSKTAFKSKPTRMVSIRPFRSQTLLKGLKVEKF